MPEVLFIGIFLALALILSTGKSNSGRDNPEIRISVANYDDRYRTYGPGSILIIMLLLLVIIAAMDLQ